MNYKVHISPEAVSDLDGIWDYIHAELYSPIAAFNTISHIMDSINDLEMFPEACPRLSSIVTIESDYRFLVSGNYLAFYRVSAPNVYVDRILYGKSDYLKTLFGHSGFAHDL